MDIHATVLVTDTENLKTFPKSTDNIKKYTLNRAIN